MRSTSSSTTTGGATGSPPDVTAGGGAGGGGAGGELLAGSGSGALTSIANPALVSSASKAVGSVQSFRGRGGAFGMLLNKVQTGQTPVRPPGAAMFDGLDGISGGGGAGGRAGSGDGTP